MRRISMPWIYVLVLACATVGSGASARLIGEKQELDMGRNASRQIEQQYRVSKNKEHIALVRGMGEKIAAVSSRPKLPWEFKVLESKEVNAFSVPGFVYVNTGLIEFADGDRDALAGVVAHEVAHTTAKHAVKSAEEQLKYGLAINLIFGNADGRKLGGIAANLTLLGYGRKHEFQADAIGCRYMNGAGYDPNGMLRFFRKLQAKEGKDSGGLAVYFRTHPPTRDRIARLEKEIVKLGKTPEPAPVTNTTETAPTSSGKTH